MIFMKTIGLIAEYNPFHNGHAYHIQKAKESGETDDALREKYFDTLNSFVKPKLQRGSDNNIVAGNKYAATVVYGQRIQRGYRPY